MSLHKQSALVEFSSNSLTGSQISFENYYEKRRSSSGQFSEKQIFNSELQFDSDFVEDSEENQILNSGIEIINIDNNGHIKDSSSEKIFREEKFRKLPDPQSYKSHSLRDLQAKHKNVTIKHHILEIFHHDKELSIWQLFGIEYLIMVIIGAIIILTVLVYKSTILEKKIQTRYLESFMDQKIEHALEKKDNQLDECSKKKISQLDLTDKTEHVVFDIRSLHKN